MGTAPPRDAAASIAGGARRAGARFGAVRGAARAAAIGLASLALGTAAVLGLLFAAVALA